MDIVPCEKKIARIEDEATVVFADGEKRRFDALFVRPVRHQRSNLPAKLGCAMTEVGIVEVDSTGQTSVPGVYAAGDMIEPMWQILPAASFTGARAGIGVSRALLVQEA
jgi:thioredoxin reductase